MYEAQAHPGSAVPATGACSGDLLLGALAACAQLTCQMVATSMEIPVRDISVKSRATWTCAARSGSTSPWARVRAIRLRFDVDAPEATPEQLESLHEKTERYCTVLQTLVSPPTIETEIVGRTR